MAVGEIEEYTVPAERTPTKLPMVAKFAGVAAAAWVVLALVGVVAPLGATTSSRVQQLTGLGAVAIDGKSGAVDKGSAWMATAMAELENAHHDGLQMLNQVHEEASKMEDSPSKFVKLALADGLATKLAQLSTTHAGEQFLKQVNQEAKSKPEWVQMIARQAARNMLLDVIHATKSEILAEHGGRNAAPTAKLAALSDRAAEPSDNDGAPRSLIAHTAKQQVSQMLPKEMGKVDEVLGAKSQPSKLAATVHAKDDGHLPVTLEVAHKLTQLVQTPAGSHFLASVKSKMTGKETPEQLDEVAYNAANTMLKQIVQSVDDSKLVHKH